MSKWSKASDVKVGDVIGEIELIARDDTTDTFLCSCGTVFTRKITGNHATKMPPIGCKDCVYRKTSSFSINEKNLTISRPYTRDEKRMIRKFKKNKGVA